MAERNFFWQEPQDDGTVKIGLTDEGKKTLGKIKFVDLPSVGQELAADDSLVGIEAEKMVQDLTTPVAGQVKTVHQELRDQPELLSDDDHDQAWLVTIQPK